MPRKLERRLLQNGKTSWRVQVATGELLGDGRRVYIRKTFTKRQDAAAFLRRLETARDEGTLVRPSGMLLADWLTHWLETIAKHAVRENTLAGYRGMTRAYIVPALGRFPLSKLKPDLIREKLYAPMIERGLAPRTMALTHSVLHNALDAAIEDGKLVRNPAKGARPPRQQVSRSSKIKPLTGDEARALLEAANGDSLRVFYVVSLGTGARPSELFGLGWEHVDLEGVPPSIRIERVLVQTGDGWVLRPPKTQAGRRVIPIAPEVVDALREHRVRQLETRLRLGKLWHDCGGFVFTVPTGEPIELHNLRRRSWVPLLKAAKLGTWIELPGTGLIDRKRHEFIPAHRLYDLRHTHATALLAAGVSVKVVSERLGHTSTTFTMDTYCHVLPAMATDAAEKAAVALLR